MSTINILYNNQIISTTDETIPVAVRYDGRTIASVLAGTSKTLNCSGKVMRGDITVGSKVMHCSGKLMSGDVTVTVLGTTYTWKKYRCAEEYSYDAELVKSNYSVRVVVASNGYAAIANTVSEVLQSDGTLSWKEGKLLMSNHDSSKVYGGNNDSLRTQSTAAKCVESTSCWASIDSYTSAIFYGTIKGNIYKPTNVQTTYTMGEYIEDVISADEDAFPTNGRADDGYWYVKQ